MKNKMAKTSSSSPAAINQAIDGIRALEIEKFRKEAAVDIARQLFHSATDKSLKNGQVRLVGKGVFKVPKSVSEAKFPQKELISYLIREASSKFDVDWLLKAISATSAKAVAVEFKGGTVEDEAVLVDKFNKAKVKLSHQTATIPASKAKADFIISLDELRATTEQTKDDVENNQWFFTMFDKLKNTRFSNKEQNMLDDDLSTATVQQLCVLSFVAKAGNEGVLTADIIDALETGLSSIQRQLGRLGKGYSFRTRGENKPRVRGGLGLIEEFQDPKNRKQMRWVLTKKGVKLFKQLNSVV